jgi:hypothetical protein
LGDEMPRRREEGINPLTVVIAIVIVFLIGKFLGLFKVFNIDPFGLEPEWVYGVLAIGIGVLYKEIRDLGKETRTNLQKIDDTLSKLGERIARLETANEIKK